MGSRTAYRDKKLSVSLCVFAPLHTHVQARGPVVRCVRVCVLLLGVCGVQLWIPILPPQQACDSKGQRTLAVSQNLKRQRFSCDTHRKLTIAGAAQDLGREAATGTRRALLLYFTTHDPRRPSLSAQGRCVPQNKLKVPGTPLGPGDDTECGGQRRL
jgi:hypothetical protein